MTEGRPIYTELVRIYEARTEADLTLVRAILAGAGIQAFAFGEQIRLARPNVDSPKAVLVPMDDATRAAEVLRQQGVIPGVVEAEDLDRLWVGLVVPLLAAPNAMPLAAALGRRDASFRTALFQALERAGPRGVALLEDVTLALALRGPTTAAREAAAFVAASEPLRERRPFVAATLGALVRRACPSEIALRVASMLERFRLLAEAERALVPLLEHAEPAVRDAAIEALFSISGGETLGYEPDALAEARATAVERWWARVGGRA